MANRLSVITTRTGDDGSTGLGDGTRVAKDAPRIDALGDVDELNSAIGVLLAEALDDDLAAGLREIQHDLFDLGAELCIPGHVALAQEQVARLDAQLATHNATLGPLREFVLPGGTRAAALAHVARTVCRRAERSVVALARGEPVGDAPRHYLNRLSDLLFVLARTLNHRAGTGDMLWRPGRDRAP